MSKHSRGGTAQKAAAAAADVTTQKRGAVELFMECVDEDLAPSQKEAGHKAKTEYQNAVERVELAHKSSTPAVTKPTTSVHRAKTSTTVPIAPAPTPASRGRGTPHIRGRGAGGGSHGRGKGTATPTANVATGGGRGRASVTAIPAAAKVPGVSAGSRGRGTPGRGMPGRGGVRGSSVTERGHGRGTKKTAPLGKLFTVSIYSAVSDSLIHLSCNGFCNQFQNQSREFQH